jgi:hypothetical protein
MGSAIIWTHNFLVLRPTPSPLLHRSHLCHLNPQFPGFESDTITITPGRSHLWHPGFEANTVTILHRSHLWHLNQQLPGFEINTVTITPPIASMASEPTTSWFWGQHHHHYSTDRICGIWTQNFLLLSPTLSPLLHRSVASELCSKVTGHVKGQRAILEISVAKS